MSFICENCNQAQKDGTKMNKVITRIRKVLYPVIKDKEEKIRIPEGFEIVKELSVCPLCFEKPFNATVVGTKVLED